MFRIDEIYYNIFLPSVQHRPLHGLHWFDPFGSVRFQDLNSLPPVPWHDEAVRYLFWDQEPLHQQTVDDTLTKFKTMYNGTHHIITSEHESDMVDYVVNTYGFIPHYYFFHGWAALDWFRGYNYSLLMPLAQRKISRTFISPNRIIAGQRNHRLILMYHILKHGLGHNHISFPRTCPAENTAIEHVIQPLLSQFPDMQQVFDQANLPRNFENETDHPMQSYRLDLFEPSQQSLLYVVTETVAQGRRHHLTEKTFKPICLGMPFVLVSTAGSLEYLRSYGFKTFDQFWDESYDTEPDDNVRLEKIGQLLKDLDNLSCREKQQLFEHTQSVINHNYNYFYHGGFANTLWQEMQNMLKELYV